MKKPSISELKALIEQGLENVPFPYVKGNSVRIGNAVIRTSKNGNFVFDMKCKKQVANTFSKTAAVAIAKKHAEGQNVVDEVMRIDHEIEKNYSSLENYLISQLGIKYNDIQKIQQIFGN